MIPVVLNGADMSQVAPPHSYINVMDFNTTEELASYLNKVDQDDELFASYFWWRDYYTVKVNISLSCHLIIVIAAHQIKKQSRIQAWCSLCENLHQRDRTQRTVNLTKILDIRNNCHRPPFLEY